MSDATRLYFGTDTHGQSLLVGAALAAAVALWRQKYGNSVTSLKARRTLGLAALVGIGLYAWGWSHINWNEDFVFLGGFTIASLAAATVLADAVLCPNGAVSRVLSIAPLRYLGTISYGLYLWHFPLDIAMSEARVGFGGYPLFAVRTATTIAVASVSYYVLERPIRTGRFFRQMRAQISLIGAAAVSVAAVLAITAIPATATSSPNAPRLSAAPTYGAGTRGVDTALAAQYAKKPVRVLLVGDSVAYTLGKGLLNTEGSYGLQIYDQGILGCGIADGRYYLDHGVVTQVVPPCEPDAQSKTCLVFGSHTVQCLSWQNAWREWLRELRPNVVVLLAGRWEVVNRTSPSGAWTNILQPSYAQYVKDQLEQAVQIATSSGARMIIETTPCFDSGEQPDGDPWPEDSPERLDAYNNLVKQVAALYPTMVTVQDLDAVVCPSGKYTTDLHGVQVRTADGVHFVEPASSSTADVVGGEYLAPALLPLWETLGHLQEAETHGASIPVGPAPKSYFLAQQ